MFPPALGAHSAAGGDPGVLGLGPPRSGCRGGGGPRALEVAQEGTVSVRTVPGHTLQLVPTPQSVVTSAPCWSHRGLPPGPSLESTPAG